MSDDEYVEGDSGSEAAETPVDEAAPKTTIDSSSVTDAPQLHTQRKTARTASARKAFAEAVLANKSKPAESKPAGAEDEFDPEAPAPIEAKKDVVAAKAAGADAKPATKAVEADPAAPADPRIAPPAPSLDPEVRKLREHLQADRDKLAAERTEWEKQRKAAEPTPIDALSFEDYIDSPSKAHRNWLETMRGEKFASDEEYKAEASDFVTALSVDVLGVPLPDNVRTAFDAAQAKKIVRTHKTIQTRKEAATQARLEKERADADVKAETERVEHEWTKACDVLSHQFAAVQDVEGKPQTSAAAKAYPWLAAEDKPGDAIVDVIRHALKKDGTQLSWQEAAKRANDFLAGEARKYYDKRKPLLAAAVEPAKPAAAPVAKAPVVPPAAVTKPNGDKKWSREKHLENTRAAFRAAIAAEPK